MSSTAWTQEALNQHLDLAIATELYTIPLYLSAASSIIQTAYDGSWTPRKHWYVEVGQKQFRSGQKQFRVFDTIISVAVEEMYHLLWACNLSAALGNRPTLTAPEYPALPAHLNVTGNYTIPGSLKDVIDLMVAIETPDAKYARDYSSDPDAFEQAAGPTGPALDDYGSIADMYHALAYGVRWYFTSGHAVSDLPQISYSGTYKETYPDVTKVTDLESAMEAIVAIVEQGEGVGVDQALPTGLVDKGKLVYDAANKKMKPDQSESKFFTEDKYSHYQRFIAVQKSLALGEYTFSTDPEPWTDVPAKDRQAAGKTAAAGASAATAATPKLATLTTLPIYQPKGTTSLASNLQTLLQAIDDCYAGKESMGNAFYAAMYNFGSTLDEVWKSGSRPTF